MLFLSASASDLRKDDWADSWKPCLRELLIITKTQNGLLVILRRLRRLNILQRMLKTPLTIMNIWSIQSHITKRACFTPILGKDGT
jgi:hypothetical protein